MFFIFKKKVLEAFIDNKELLVNLDIDDDDKVDCHLLSSSNLIYLQSSTTQQQQQQQQQEKQEASLFKQDVEEIDSFIQVIYFYYHRLYIVYSL